MGGGHHLSLSTGWEELSWAHGTKGEKNVGDVTANCWPTRTSFFTSVSQGERAKTSEEPEQMPRQGQAWQVTDDVPVEPGGGGWNKASWHAASTQASRADGLMPGRMPRDRPEPVACSTPRDQWEPKI